MGCLCCNVMRCMPCKFADTTRGCLEGVLCGLCHFPHSEMARSAKRALHRKSDCALFGCTLESLLPCSFPVAEANCPNGHSLVSCTRKSAWYYDQCRKNMPQGTDYDWCCTCPHQVPSGEPRLPRAMNGGVSEASRSSVESASELPLEMSWADLSESPRADDDVLGLSEQLGVLDSKHRLERETVNLNGDARVLLQFGELVDAGRLAVEEHVLAVDVISREMKSAQVVSVRTVAGAQLVKIELDQAGLAIFSDAPDCLKARGLLPVSLLCALPRDERGRILSLGSRHHNLIGCRCCVPCTFTDTTRGCLQGVLCGLCHFPHSEMTRSAKRALNRKSDCAQSGCTLESLLPHNFPGAEVPSGEPRLPQAMDGGVSEAVESACQRMEVRVRRTFVHFETPRLEASVRRFSSI